MEGRETEVVERGKGARQEVTRGRTAGVMTSVGSPVRMGKETSPPPNVRTLRSEDEDDSSQERRKLESRLEKLKEKKTRRLREEIFRNEDLYIDLQKNRSGPGGRNTVKTVKASSPLKQGAAGMTFQQSPGSLGHETDSTNKEVEDAHENEDMSGQGDFQGHHDEDMVGQGDFQGHHVNDATATSEN